MKQRRRFIARRVDDSWASAWPRYTTWEVFDRSTGRVVARGFDTRQQARDEAHVRETRTLNPSA